MNAITYFFSIDKIHSEMIQKQLEVQEMKDSLMLSGISYEKDKIQSNGSLDSFGDKMAKLADLEQEYTALIEKYNDELNLATLRTHMMENREYGSILEEHYIDGASIRVMAKKRHKSINAIKCINNRALKEFEKTFLTETPIA